MRLSYLVGAASALLLASFATANAQQGVQVGVLRCHGGPNVGQILTSTTNLDCVFEGRGRRPEGYVATIRRFGVDLGATSQTDFGWRVHAPTVQVGPGDLSGSYALPFYCCIAIELTAAVLIMVRGRATNRPGPAAS